MLAFSTVLQARRAELTAPLNDSRAFGNGRFPFGAVGDCARSRTLMGARGGLDAEHCALAASSCRRARPKPSDRILQQPVQHVVIMRWIVMERNEPFCTYLGRKLESVLVGAVPPSKAACVFLVRILSVVNQ